MLADRQDDLSNLKRNKVPLLGEFIIFASLATALFAVLAGWFGYTDYEARKNYVILQVETEAERLEHSLNDVLEHAEYLFIHINNQVAENSSDLKAIARLLKTFSMTNKQTRDIFSLSMFTWVNKNGYATVNSELGILEKPVNFNDRQSFIKSKIKPERVFFSPPDIGKLSGELVIPVSVGAIDDSGKFVGATVAGYSIEGLKKRLSRDTKISDVYFILMDNKGEFIASNYEDLNESIVELIEKVKPFIEKNMTDQYLNKSFFLSSDSFAYFTKSKEYPFSFIVIYDKSASDKEIYQVLIAYNLEIALMALVMVSFFLVLRNRIVRPVIDLSNAAEQIASSETDASFSIDHEAYEISVLAKKLSEIHNMKQQIVKAREEVSLANQHLESRVKERTLELEKALQAKSEFLNNMSHEIRTPIHGVLGYSEVLLEDWQNLNEQQRLDLASKIYRAGDRLLVLINSLLDLSRLASGKIEFDFQDNDLKTLAQEMIEDSEPLYLNKKTIEIKLFINTENTIAYFDKEKIRQVMRNLFANAIKFTSDGLLIVTIFESLMENKKGNKVQCLGFSISDNGIGIPENELAEVFHPFSQSSRTKSMAGGTGLGLSICHEIIDAHHGKIWASNNENRNGATFTFLIPCKRI